MVQFADSITNYCSHFKNIPTYLGSDPKDQLSSFPTDFRKLEVHPRTVGSSPSVNKALTSHPADPQLKDFIPSPALLEN